jgi:hypothetical protein
MSLKEFKKMLNLEKTFENMKKSYLGDRFYIDFDINNNRICWFNKAESEFTCGYIDITKDLDRIYFDCQIKHIENKMDKIEEMQKDLTITAEDCRTMLFNEVNKTLANCNLKPIKIKKYKTTNELLKEIKKINANNPKLTDFLEVNNSTYLLVYLLQDKHEEYYTDTSCREDDAIIDNISVPIDKILNKDGILYQLSTRACQDIMNDEYDYHQFATWEL